MTCWVQHIGGRCIGPRLKIYLLIATREWKNGQKCGKREAAGVYVLDALGLHASMPY